MRASVTHVLECRMTYRRGFCLIRSSICLERGVRALLAQWVKSPGYFAGVGGHWTPLAYP